jgi:hypothetical protein
MKKILTLIVISIVFSTLLLVTPIAIVRADSTDLINMPVSTPIIREVDGALVPTPKEPQQNHWWDIFYWADTSGGYMPPQMNGQFVAVSNTIGNLASSDAVLYLPLNVAYGTSRNNCVWFQFDVQFDPNNGVRWFIWDIRGPATNPDDYHYTSIPIPYTPGHVYEFSLITSGTNTVTFNIVDTTTHTSWSFHDWVWTVPSINMLYDQSMFSPASAVEGYTTNNQLTNVPYFQTKVGYGISNFWHSPGLAPSGIGSDVNNGPSGYYYWYMYDGSINAKTIIYGLNWLRRTQGTDGSWNFGGWALPTGVTSLAVMCFVNYGVSPNDPNVSSGLGFLLSRRNTDGSFGSLYTYETSLALLALSAARSAGYNPPVPNVDQYITDAMNWLLSNQNIETNTAISPSSPYYGGWYYYGAYPGWSDLSNTQFAMIALSLAESYLKVPPHINNWQAASIFAARCNNNATNNPQFYLKNDGGFIYQPQSTIRTSTGDSYGSMTAAGVWVLSLARMAGITQIDMQVKKIDSIDPIYSGLKWLEDHYSVTQNPVNYYWGGDSFTYYYYWTVSKAWEITGQKTVAGHDWYAELTAHLASAQSSDGHWPGTGGEEPDGLATEWAILSIELPIVPQQVLQNSKLKVILNSGADLHVYDQHGRHVGYNYITQQNEVQIPGATYSGREVVPQIITVPLTEGLKYTIEVVGTTGGSYELVVDVTTYDVVVAERSFTGTTSPGLSFPYTVEVVTIAGLSLLVQPIISLSTTLEIGQPHYTRDNNIFVTSDTPFTLHIIDGSGVVSTTYRVFNATYDSGWIDYTEPFYLVGLADGTYSINYNSSDTSGNVENIHTAIVILDNTSPLLTIEIPYEGAALQDGVTFKVIAWDVSDVASVTFSILCAQGNIISSEFQSMSATLSANGEWELHFDTTRLPDGYYLFVANGTDVLGNWGTINVQFSIRNWAAIELLPASNNNKAGRTMPIKFSLRLKATVDSTQPFIWNEELTIKIYQKGHPEIILQTSTYGTTARDYRIDPVNELYITNFQTLKTPTTYIVEIYRKGMLIGWFEFSTVK